MKQYSRVSYATRCQIYAFLQAKLSIPEIATLVGFHKSTIYRELKRNKDFNHVYRPDLAQDRSSRRYLRCRKKYALTPETKRIVEKLLKFGMSPLQASGRIRYELNSGPSHQTIYNYVYRAGLRGYLRRHGKRGAGRYLQRRRIRNLNYGLPISNRPEIANSRGRIGDWERDTMHTYGGVQILVCIDRKSRLIKIDRVTERTTKAIGDLTLKIINETGKRPYTITNDNGGDFKGKSDMKTRTFFCSPMKPQQRGSVENVIGSLRQYITRKTDVCGFTKNDFIQMENLLNYRPRKVLGYKTPYEVYYKVKVALAI